MVLFNFRDNFWRFLSILLTLFYFGSPQSWALTECSFAFLETQIDVSSSRQDEILNENQFYISRGLFKYIWYLGYGFFHKAASLNEQQTWLDVGAGAARAQRDFSSLRKRRPRLLAFGITEPKSPGLEKFKSANRNFTYLADGRAIERILVSEIGQVDLISDVFGALTYSLKPHEVLKAYYHLLHVGGEAHIFMPLEDATSIRMQMMRPDLDVFSDAKIFKLFEIQDSAGRTHSILEWLQSLEGFDLVKGKIIGSLSGESNLRLVLRRNEKPFSISRLKLSRTSPGSPPERLFSLD